MSLGLFARYGLTRPAPGGGGACDQTGITSATGFGTASTTSQYGWRFTVGSNDLSVCKLRIYTGNNANHTIRLWRVSDQALITSATIDTSGTTFHEVVISPVTLASGADYIVSHRRTDGTIRFAGTNPSYSVNSELTYVESRFINGDGFPSSVSANALVSADIGFSVL